MAKLRIERQTGKQMLDRMLSLCKIKSVQVQRAQQKTPAQKGRGTPNKNANEKTIIELISIFRYGVKIFRCLIPVLGLIMNRLC